MRQFTDNILGILGEHYYQCCSSHPTHSRRQYRDYIIDLYGVKDSTMSYSKCAMPSLSCLLSFYTIPISLFFNSKIFFYFLVIIERCRDGCRTSLLIAGGCSCSTHFSYSTTILPSLQHHSFCRNDFFHLFHSFLRMHA